MKRLQVLLALLVILAMLLPACQPAVNNNLAVPPVSSGIASTEGSSKPPTDGTTIPSVPGSTPSSEPATEPENAPSSGAATHPSAKPSKDPSESSSTAPTEKPTVAPTETPTVAPTVAPTEAPTTKPTERPTEPTEPSVPPTTQPSQNKGSGTKNDPFLITCLEDLLNLKNVLNKSGYYYKQTADIDCSSVGNWVTIGDESHPFRHHYDGNGYSISNLRFDGEACALFSWVEDSHFRNMNIVNAHSSENYRVEEHRTGRYPGSGGYTGAIVGYGVGCSFENCRASVNFKSSNSTTGGLIGFLVLKSGQKDVAVNCHVTGTMYGGGALGGLIGEIWAYLHNSDSYIGTNDRIFAVRNCSAEVDFTMYVISTERAGIGGIVGIANGIHIEKCYAKGTINALGGDIGGLVGYARHAVEVTRCYAEVDITSEHPKGKGGVSIGGLIGYMLSYTNVHDCYATGDINMPYASWSPCQDSAANYVHIRFYNPCGSLIGCIECLSLSSDYHKINVYNCYATGTVTAPNICEDERVYCHGALVGLVFDKATVNCITDTSKKDQSDWSGFSDTVVLRFDSNYNLENLRTYYTPMNRYKGSGTSGLRNPVYNVMPQHTYVQIITTAQLAEQSTFEGWDFVNVWKLTANGPVLR